MMSLAALALFLAFQQNKQPAKPIGTFDEPASASPQSFHSAGVHGAIDAGGYAASAGEKVQTEFFELLTDLQIAALRTAWAPKDACAASNAARQNAIVMLSRGDFAAAAAALEKLLSVDGQPATRQLLGLAYEGVGQCAAAAEQFATASPTEADLFAESIALLLEGDVARAEAVARRGSQLDASPASLNRLSLGAVLFQLGEVGKALSLFLDAARARASDRAAFEFIAIAARSADPASLTRSAAVLGSLTQQQPENASAHYALASVLSAEGVPTAALEAELKRAVALDPQFADAHFRLAAIYAEREDLAAAINDYTAAVTCNPRLVEAHYRLSQLYGRVGNMQRAKEERELHQKLRARQKSDQENGKVPVRLAGIKECK